MPICLAALLRLSAFVSISFMIALHFVCLTSSASLLLWFIVVILLIVVCGSVVPGACLSVVFINSFAPLLIVRVFFIGCFFSIGFVVILNSFLFCCFFLNCHFYMFLACLMQSYTIYL
jgi:hypothetical protein